MPLTIRIVAWVCLFLPIVEAGWAKDWGLRLSQPGGATQPVATPLSHALDLSLLPAEWRVSGGMLLAEGGQGTQIPTQFQADSPGSPRGTLSWIVPPGPAGARVFRVQAAPRPPVLTLEAVQDPATGRWEIRDQGKPVLGYNYQTNLPGDRLGRISDENRKYARARGDYLHPLYGPDGEELTLDWPVDHPHHRGIYWAWPEVDVGGERGDLHALQRVFARPTGQCAGRSGAVFAEIEAENVWLWEDQWPIVRERVFIRAWRADSTGRCVDLEFRFTALRDDVMLARREARLYGGLNLRLAPVTDQRIDLYTDPAGAVPRRAWGVLSGRWAGSPGPASLAVLQHSANPDAPGDWIQYPELNWFQPTFPAPGTRFALKPGEPLVLRYRLWIQRGRADASRLAQQWSDYAAPPRVILEPL
jgi:hypothetical protein